jgi:glycosyltransferase involved in cell wall biosynthesis
VTDILFVSGLEAAPWGAAEELWQQTALCARARGVAVKASVRAWAQRPAPVARMLAAGIEVEERRGGLGRLVAENEAAIIVVQQPDVFAGLPWMTFCAERRRPYVTLTHYAAEHEWPSGEIAFALRQGYAQARRAFFISEATRRLAEVQTAQTLARAEIVRAPYRVAFDQAMPWPEGDGLRLACVARLDAEDKGQDTLIRLMATEKWRARDVRIDLCGVGPHAALLHAMIEWQRVESVQLRGYVDDLHALWRSHHALVLPSRAEGLPAAIVEAMLCRRVCVVSNVGGNAELLEDGRTGFVAAGTRLEDIDAALDRMWQSRGRLAAMGRAAGDAVRALVPRDPAAAFCQRLLEVAAEAHQAA